MFLKDFSISLKLLVLLVAGGLGLTVVEKIFKKNPPPPPPPTTPDASTTDIPADNS